MKAGGNWIVPVGLCFLQFTLGVVGSLTWRGLLRLCNAVLSFSTFG